MVYCDIAAQVTARHGKGWYALFVRARERWNDSPAGLETDHAGHAEPMSLTIMVIISFLTAKQRGETCSLESLAGDLSYGCDFPSAVGVY